MKSKYETNIIVGTILIIVLSPLLFMFFYVMSDNNLIQAILFFLLVVSVPIFIIVKNVRRNRYDDNLCQNGKKAAGRYLRFEKKAITIGIHITYYCSAIVEFTDDVGTLREGHTDFCFSINDIEDFERHKDMTIFYDDKSPKIIISQSEK
jgi:hypothetical protein